MPSPGIYAFPGQKCNNSGLCRGEVRDGYCRGKVAGADCRSHLECDVGLRCDLSFKCNAAGEEGDACDNDNRLCQSYLHCHEGVCFRYGSLPDDASAGKSGADICSSHYVDHHNVCRPGPKLLGPIFVNDLNQICLYSDFVEEMPECGFHRDGKAICRPGEAQMLSRWNNVRPVSHPLRLAAIIP